jgi:erythromycin esterase
VKGLAATVAAAVIVVLACAADDDSAAAGASGRVGEPPSAEAAWLRGHGQRLRALKGRSVADLRFLAPLLEGKRIVQLGESGHGMREASLIKLRLVRYLHRELGFSVLAFESPLDQCDRVDATVGSGDPALAMTGCVYEVWQTQEVLDLFRYVQKTRATSRPLRIAGFDIQPSGWNKRGRPALLREIVRQVDPLYADAVMAMDGEFIEEYDKGSDSRREWLRREKELLVPGYRTLARFLDDHAAELAKPFAGTERAHDPIVARQTALSMAWYVEQQAEAPHGKEFVEARDRAMAANMEFILDERFPGEKVIVWGHNFHLRHDSEAIEPREDLYPGVRVRTMGSMLAESHRQEMYTIGIFPGRGSTADGSGSERSIGAPPPGSMEAILESAGIGMLFVDLPEAERAPGSAWISTPVEARDDGLAAYAMIPRQQFDAILFLARVSPRQAYR